MPIQSGAQEVIKIAMGELMPHIELFRSDGRVIRPLIQIHDDLVFEIGDNDLGVFLPILKNVMEHAVELKVPTPVDIKMGKRWEPMSKWKM